MLNTTEYKNKKSEVPIFSSGKTKLFFLSMIVAVVLSGCRGDDGVEGPQGPAGSNGTNGTNGAANVSSGFYDPNWDPIIPNYYTTFTVTSITDTLNDIVLVFCKRVAGGSWEMLPVYDFACAGSNIGFSYNLGNVIVNYYSIVCIPLSTWRFRVVVIKPALARDHPDVDYNNYEEVKAAFNLTD